MAGKTDFVSRLAVKQQITKAEASRNLEGVLDLIQELLVNGEKISLQGFGTFEVRERAERNGRNPQTGEAITIAAQLSPAFKASKSLKDAVNN